MTLWYGRCFRKLVAPSELSTRRGHHVATFLVPRCWGPGAPGSAGGPGSTSRQALPWGLSSCVLRRRPRPGHAWLPRRALHSPLQPRLRRARLPTLRSLRQPLREALQPQPLRSWLHPEVLPRDLLSAVLIASLTRGQNERRRKRHLTELRFDMATNHSGHSRRTYVGWSSAFWAAALLIAGLLGGGWFVLAAAPVSEEAPLVAVLALAAVVGITWQHSRVSARRRLLAALAAYADREIRQQQCRTSRPPRSAD
jgi:hypothetical protein